MNCENSVLMLRFVREFDSLLTEADKLSFGSEVLIWTSSSEEQSGAEWSSVPASSALQMNKAAVIRAHTNL